MRNIISILLIFSSTSTFAVTFSDAIRALESHESIEAIKFQSSAMSEAGELNGSWGDPMFKIAAKNFPKESLRQDESPMTGIEFGLSQKISLTTKYGNIEDSYKSLANAYKYQAQDKREALVKSFWDILILNRKIKEEREILNENNIWLSKILKVSKRLYSTGKISQQALLDIQIRKAEVESELSNKNFNLSQVRDRIRYLIGSDDTEVRSIPWAILATKNNKVRDNKELSLEEKLKSKEFAHTASKLNYIPDITFSLGYTKRSDIDDQGDFVGASISFPLPFSSQKYANNNKAVQEKYQSIKDFEVYKKEKNRDVSLLEKEIQMLNNDIQIMNSKTIKFARNSRDITSKSYGLGNSSYVELLQSELKLQKILMQKVSLVARRDMARANLKYIRGEALHE